MKVDTSGEDTKSGVDAEEAVTLATHILTNCPHLKLKGASSRFFMSFPSSTARGRYVKARLNAVLS